MKNSHLIALTLSSILISMPAFASVSTSVHFPIGQNKGTFACTFAGSGEVDIDTNNINAKGFCPGEAGPGDHSQVGHLHAKSNEIEQYYFEVEKQGSDKLKDAHVDVTGQSGITDVICESGHGGKQEAYPGEEFCLVRK